jgi:GNAT superfamily N-acetyltransferase
VVVVTAAASQHVKAVAALFEEMDYFYGATEIEPLEQRIRQITDALFGDVPAAAALLAWDGAELVGVAAYSFLWPAIGVTRSLYLKELYVGESHRRKGAGKLIDALFEVAAKHECSRVEWTTDRPNTAAQQFYAELGVPVNEAKLFYRVEIANT